MIGCRSVCSKKLISHEITKYSLFPMIFFFQVCNRNKEGVPQGKPYRVS